MMRMESLPPMSFSTGSILLAQIRTTTGFPMAIEGTDDNDDDGISDALDLDSDNDGLSDAVEGGELDSDGDGVLDFRDADDDGDGIDTKDEAVGLASTRDLDGDGSSQPSRHRRRW